MLERTYIVTWVTADGQTKTASVIARNHQAVERFIKKRGGTLISLDRDEEKAPKTRSIRHAIWSVVFFVVIAVAAVAAYWWRRLR